MSAQKILLVLTVLVISIPQLILPIALADVSQEQAASALAYAEKTVFSAYQVVSETSGSGANVSSLLIRLNEAAWFLARAQAAYKSGEFNSTLGFATQSQDKLNPFFTDADALKEIAVREHNFDFLINIFGSIIGAIGVVCVSLLVWFFLKRKYERVESAV